MGRHRCRCKCYVHIFLKPFTFSPFWSKLRWLIGRQLKTRGHERPCFGDRHKVFGPGDEDVRGGVRIEVGYRDAPTSKNNDNQNKTKNQNGSVCDIEGFGSVDMLFNLQFSFYRD